MTITKAMLEARAEQIRAAIQRFEQETAAARAAVQRFEDQTNSAMGALQECERWLAELNAADAPSAPAGPRPVPPPEGD